MELEGESEQAVSAGQDLTTIMPLSKFILIIEQRMTVAMLLMVELMRIIE